MPLPKILREARYRAFYRFLLAHNYPVETLGDPKGGCQWRICPVGLGPQSIVYSGGLGSDISFEHELVKRFGCQLVLYDPSPTGLQTMSRPENQLPNFHFFPVALTGQCGRLSLGPPKAGEDSWFARKGAAGAVEVECTDLASLMQKNGHSRIDLLKMDIEGSEYEAIKHLLRRRLPVTQLCVEFHHTNLPGVSRRQTIRTILSLVLRGYRLIDQSGANHTFIWGKTNK